MRRLVILGLIFVMLLLPALARPAAAQSGGGTVHVVQLGETLYGIAMHYGVSASAIAAASSACWSKSQALRS